MIVNIRGTNGSGKSHIVRTLLTELDDREHETVHDPRQRRPIGIRFPGELFVAGHYWIGNGGMDTLQFSCQDAWELCRTMSTIHRAVLCEGKNQSRDVQFIERLPVLVVHLVTPLEECVASVRSRGHTLSEESITRTHRKCERDARYLEDAGLEVLRLTRDDALAAVREKIKWA